MLSIVLFICLLISIITGIRMIAAIRRYSYTPATLGDEEPTVSICITARNERHALTQCLERILASNYERQEVLVLDDASEDNTSMVIKSFAHAGVRFIPGRDLPRGWLGRNHAYQTLAREASGDIVLYIDVDTLIQSHTIRELVAYYNAHNLLMLSVLPRREDGLRLSALFGSLRHAWELIVSTKQTPPCTSGVWMIDRTILLSVIDQTEDFGIQMRIEHTIAHAVRRLKQYRYLIARPELGVRYEKRWHSQAETAQRLYYPMFGGTPLRAVTAIMFLLSLVAPIVLAIIYLIPVALLTVGLSMLWYGYYNLTLRRPIGAVVKSLLWPLLIIQELGFLIISIARYATNTVTWKGRHVRAQPTNHSHLQLD